MLFRVSRALDFSRVEVSGFNPGAPISLCGARISTYWGQPQVLRLRGSQNAVSHFAQDDNYGRGSKRTGNGNSKDDGGGGERLLCTNEEVFLWAEDGIFLCGTAFGEVH